MSDRTVVVRTTQRVAVAASGPQGPTGSGGGGGGAVDSVNTRTGDVVLTKTDVGLANADNTADTDKPVSTATQAALDAKQASDSDLTAIAGLSPSNDDLIQRKAGAWTNRTPAQLKTDLAVTKTDVGLGNVPNTDATARANHTGTQTASTISDFNSAADARVALVVDAAPGTLDTLNELAAALGDDANFATTVTNSLATKANDADVVHDTGAETIAGVKTFSSDPLIPDEAYGVGWNGSLEPATKNALYDKIETIGGGGGSLSDGDKGDITVTDTGATWTIDNNAVTLAKIQDIATARILGRNTSGSGDIEELTAATTKTLLALTKGDVGLANVDNTSDASKPVSTATQTALDLKANDTDVVHDSGDETVAGVKTFSSDPLIPDEAYGAGWNGSLEPPTKNAVYDKMETIGGGAEPDVQSFTSSGTWTKPAGITYVDVVCIGGGGGGASGRKDAALTARSGGGGGGGGAYSRQRFVASALPGTVAVTVGAGGAGGAAQTTNTANGNNGTTGGTSQFGDFLRASGGSNGTGGGTASGAAGVGGLIGALTGGSGTAGGTTSTSAPTSVNYLQAAGGAGGHGMDASDTTGTTRAGGGTNVNGRAGGATVATGNPGLPPAVESAEGDPTPGAGGSSGRMFSDQAAKAGGRGGKWGGGGAGGTAGTNGVTDSGAGGAGGDGYVLVVGI